MHQISVHRHKHIGLISPLAFVHASDSHKFRGKVGQVADQISYMSMMSAFETTGHWQEALQFLEDVQAKGVQASGSLTLSIGQCISDTYV